MPHRLLLLLVGAALVAGTGAEVLDLLPTGYGFAMDMEGEHRMVFDAKAVEQMVNFTMQRMYG